LFCPAQSHPTAKGQDRAKWKTGFKPIAFDHPPESGPHQPGAIRNICEDVKIRKQFTAKQCKISGVKHLNFEHDSRVGGLLIMPHSEETGGFSAAFTTTQWSEVLDARQTDPERARAALENLCSRYWYPLYAFVRRRGHGPHDAEDLTQSFFAHLLSHDALRSVDPAKGLFRTFLLSSLVNFLNDQHDRHQALKRGGGNNLINSNSIANPYGGSQSFGSGIY